MSRIQVLDPGGVPFDTKKALPGNQVTSLFVDHAGNVWTGTRLNGSTKTTILAGAGCAGAHAELVELAARLNAPIVHAMRGKEFIEYDNPYDVGMTGLLGFSSGYRAMMTCDVLLMIGTDFPYQQFFPKEATVVQIDIRGEQLGRRTKVDYGFVGDTKTTLQALLPKLTQNQDDWHLKTSLENYQKVRRGLDELATGEWARNRSIRSMLFESSTSWLPKMQFSPAMSARRLSGRHAI